MTSSLVKLLAQERNRTGYAPMLMVPGRWGALAPGNLDLKARPLAHNSDGSISTVRSITITDDKGRAYLLPTVIDNRVVSDAEAIKHFQQTGQHLGVFPNEKKADRYAEALHKQQAQFYGV